MKDGLGDVQSVLVLGGGERDRAGHRAGARGRAAAARSCWPPAAPTSWRRVAAEIRGPAATTVETVAFDADRTEDHPAVIGAAFDRHRDLDVVAGRVRRARGPARDRRRPGRGVAIARTNFVGAVSAGLVAAGSSPPPGPRHARGAVVGGGGAGPQGQLRVRVDQGRRGRRSPGPRRRAGARGVRVLVVRPGFVHTKMTEGRRAGAAGDRSGGGGPRRRGGHRRRQGRRVGPTRPALRVHRAPAHSEVGVAAPPRSN